MRPCGRPRGAWRPRGRVGTAPGRDITGERALPGDKGAPHGSPAACMGHLLPVNGLAGYVLYTFWDGVVMATWG